MSALTHDGILWMRRLTTHFGKRVVRSLAEEIELAVLFKYPQFIFPGRRRWDYSYMLVPAGDFFLAESPPKSL